MSTKVAVVIPVYRELDELEKISLDRCRKVLGRYPLVFVAPEGKNFSCFEVGDTVAEFPAKYFQSIQTYSELLLTPQFYETFFEFDYMLIYQLDAFVFYDALEEFCSLGYDYIGAPWPRYAWQGSQNPKTPKVGNGGFSLRKIKACHKLLTYVEIFPDWTENRQKYIEDAFFAICGVRSEFEFNVAPVAAAELFSMEWHPDKHVKKIGGLPFGCHGWTKMNADFYVELFGQFGYDLRPFQEQMRDENYYQKQTPIRLKNLALKRLTCRIERSRSLSRYLPTKKFASIRVIRSPEALEILAQLLTEENSLTDKIFIYNEETWADLLLDVTRENLPHLIIVADYDVSLVAAVENRGLRYGEHVISFRQEYLKNCEELFHSLGR